MITGLLRTSDQQSSSLSQASLKGMMDEVTVQSGSRLSLISGQLLTTTSNLYIAQVKDEVSRG